MQHAAFLLGLIAIAAGPALADDEPIGLGAIVRKKVADAEADARGERQAPRATHCESESERSARVEREWRAMGALLGFGSKEELAIWEKKAAASFGTNRVARS